MKASLVAVSDLSILVNSMALQSSLNDTNNALNIAYDNISALGEGMNNGYNTLYSSLTLKASQANLDFTNTTVASKSSQIALDDLNILVNSKALQTDLDFTNTTLASKASLIELNNISNTLNNDYNTLNTFVATRASNTSLSLKQDLIGDKLDIGSLNISGNSDFGI